MSITSDPALAGAFANRSADDARTYYDGWAATYDGENLAKGFRLPYIGAMALVRHLAPDAGPVLDGACGTGLVGEGLAHFGYRLTGCDLSQQMLAAAARIGAYAALDEADLTALPYADGAFAGFIAMGATGPGHAPPAALAELARVTRPGGIGVFSLREDTYEGQGFAVAMAELAAAGTWRERHMTGAFRTYLLGEEQLFSRVVTVEVLG